MEKYIQIISFRRFQPILAYFLLEKSAKKYFCLFNKKLKFSDHFAIS